MANFRSIFLIDSDTRRRAALTHCANGQNIHVEPFESEEELMRRWPADGLILAYDSTDRLEKLLAHMGNGARWMPVVAYCEVANTRRIVEAVIAGAIDYVTWPISLDDLLEIVISSQRKATELRPLRMREVTARARIGRLSKRERQVLAGITEGLSNRVIGERISISPRTVEIHRANMLTKMGAHHTSQAIRWACEAGEWEQLCV